MNEAEFVERKKEFDRQIKECRMAEVNAATIKERLDCVNRQIAIEKQKQEFFQKWVNHISK